MLSKHDFVSVQSYVIDNMRHSKVKTVFLILKTHMWETWRVLYYYHKKRRNRFKRRTYISTGENIKAEHLSYTFRRVSLDVHRGEGEGGERQYDMNQGNKILWGTTGDSV